MAHELAEELGKDVDLVFKLSTYDDIAYESSDGRHFEEGEAVDLKSISSISFELIAFKPRCSVELRLAHGDSKYSNSLSVSGEDSGWVHKTFSRLKERLESVEPSESWFTLHHRLFFHLSAVGLGAAVQMVIALFVNLMFWLFSAQMAALTSAVGRPPTWLEGLVRFFDTPPLVVMWWWFLGVPWAWQLRDWVLKAWPSIDLDTGPTSKRRASQRRTRIGTFIALVLVPLVCSVVYDILKSTVWDTHH
jgi:hypothetical protein